MHTNKRTTWNQAGAGEGAAGATAVEAAELERLVARVRQADRLLAEAVELAGRLAGSGACEQIEGLPLEHYVGLAARTTGADARMLVSAGETLAAMPATAALFREGAVSWGQVRAIVLATRRLPVAERQAIDERVAATTAEYPRGVESFDPEGLVWAVEAAVDELTPARTERSERRATQRTFLARQMDLDGGMRCYGEFDPVAAAVLNNAIDGRMGGRPPAGAGDPGRDEQEEVGGRDAEEGVPAGSWTSTATGRVAAGALVGVCADWLGGDTGRPARPLLVAHVDVSDVTAQPCGTVELDLRGPLPRVGAGTVELLARDADLRAVLFEGKRPLAASGKVDLRDIPARTRFAVRARDRGDRFPGSQDPIGFTDVDHLQERARRGDHHPDNLASFSRRKHTLRHRHGWTVTLDPASAMVTVRRRGRAFNSLPRGTPLARRPERPPGEPAGGRPPGGTGVDASLPF